MKNKLTANMDRHIGLSLLLLALALIIFGCSSGGNSDSNDNGNNVSGKGNDGEITYLQKDDSFVIELGAQGGGAYGNRDNTVPSGAGGAIGTYDPNGFKGAITPIYYVWDTARNQMVSVSAVQGVETSDNEIHGFGNIDQIPPQRAGELILTVLPSTAPTAKYNYAEWYKETFAGGRNNSFGLPPEAVNAENGEWWGLADPSIETSDRGYAFVKNGFPNESNVKGYIKVAPTRCTTKKVDANGANVNCLHFNMLVRQPFQIVVTVLDESGNFVTKYQEQITPQEYRNITQAPNYVPSSEINNIVPCPPECQAPTSDGYGKPNTLVGNGLMNVSVNIYPISANGKRWANGIYIAKIERVDLQYEGCASSGGASVFIEGRYGHQQTEERFGWGINEGGI